MYSDDIAEHVSEPTATEGAPKKNGTTPESANGTRSAHPPRTRPDGSILAIRALWRGRYWIASASLIAAGAAAAYFANHPVQYESTAIVMRAMGEPLESMDSKTRWQPPSDLVRLKHLATSSQVLHGLINRYDLYRHYFIDTTATGYFELAMAQLQSSISVVVLDESTVSISVMDADRLKAKQLADGLVEQLLATVRQLSERHLGMQMQLTRNMLKHQEDEITRHMGRLTELGAGLTPNMTPTAAGEFIPALELQQQLVQIGAGLTEAHAELQSFTEQLELMETMNRTNPVGELIVVNYALQDMRRAPQSIIASRLLLWALVGAFACAFVLALWGIEGPRVKALWSEARSIAH